MKSSLNNKKLLKFPVGFYWGTATSSHQIEGNNINNDWWRAEQEGKIKHKSGKAADSYNRYEEDFDLARDMHNNAHRFSIEWSRIEPWQGEFNQKEIEHYRKVIQALRARGMEPFVTLHHFTNPIWFADMGGWANKKAPFYFARYAEYVVKELGDEAKYWITINEPFILGTMGFMEGVWPPFKTGILNVLKVIFNLYRAHKRAYRKIKAIDSNLQVGFAKSLKYFKAQADHFFFRIASAFFDLILNYGFLKSLKNEQDFMGINYYYPVSISPKLSHPKNWMGRLGNNAVSDFANVPAYENYGWEIYPKGLYYVLKHVSEFKKPIFIFENGISDTDDDQRPRFIKDHLKWLHKAISEGADVRGYFHWSLLDNFEWAEGYKQKFGLVEVDFDTLERKPRGSSKLYGEICRKNGLESDN